MPFESEFKKQPDGHSEKGPVPRADRKLGDEWEDWDGTAYEELNEPKGRFILLATLVWLAISLMMIAAGYLVSPRLEQWPVAARWTFQGIFIALIGGGTLFYLLVVLEILTERFSILPYRWSERMLLWLLPKAVWIGGHMGISRDHVANSFVKVNNALTRSYGRRIDRAKPIILLPRCLNRANRQDIRKTLEGRSYGVFTVGGGEEARKAIQQEHPSFIIALACERDLISGIRDVALDIPVIAIPNKRPEGPCKNTHIDMKDFLQALAFFENSGNPKR